MDQWALRPNDPTDFSWTGSTTFFLNANEAGLEYPAVEQMAEELIRVCEEPSFHDPVPTRRRRTRQQFPAGGYLRKEPNLEREIPIAPERAEPLPSPSTSANTLFPLGQGGSGASLGNAANPGPCPGGMTGHSDPNRHEHAESHACEPFASKW